MFSDITSQITVVERNILLKITCLCGFTPLEIPETPFVKCPQCGRNYYHQTISSILMEEPPIIIPPVSENWQTIFKDNSNSRIANPIPLPLTQKWKQQTFSSTIYNIPKLLLFDNKIIVCYTRKMYVPSYGYVQATAYDVETGNLVWKAKSSGDGYSKGSFVIDKNKRMWIGGGHNGNIIIDAETGNLIQILDWYSGIKETWTNVDENGTYSYGSGSVDSYYLRIRANDLDLLKMRWMSAGQDMRLTGISSGGFGQPATYNNILYVPNGILCSYDSTTGSVIWERGCYPKQEIVGQVCHWGAIIINNDRLHVFGKECLALHQGDWSVPGVVYPIWDIPRLYEYDLNGNLINKIDLKNYVDSGYYQHLYKGYLFPYNCIIASDKMIISGSESLSVYNRNDFSLIYSIPYNVHALPKYRDSYNMVLCGDVLFVEQSQYVFALNVNTGIEIWRSDQLCVDPVHISWMLAGAGKLYMVTTGNALFCLGE